MPVQYLYSSSSALNNVVASKYSAQESVDMESLHLNILLLHEKKNSSKEDKRKGKVQKECAHSSEPQKAYSTSEFILVLQNDYRFALFDL